jgi:hypothetical protein
MAATMTTTTEYRQFAEECLEAMRAALIPEVRAALFVAAQRWSTLADQREEGEHLPASAHGRHHLRGDTGALARNYTLCV